MSDWISVEERLPEELSGLYIEKYLTYRYGVMEVLWWGEDGPSDWQREGITHWMPLPSPPTDSEEK